MSDAVTFDSQMAPEAVSAALTRALERSSLSGGMRPQLTGTVQDLRVSLYRRRPYTKNMPVLAFDGVISARGAGSVLEGRYSYRSVGFVFVAAAYLFAGFGLVGMAKGVWAEDFELFVVSALFFAGSVGVAYLVPRLGQSFRRDESDLLGQEIRAVLSGRGV